MVGSDEVLKSTRANFIYLMRINYEQANNKYLGSM